MIKYSVIGQTRPESSESLRENRHCEADGSQYLTGQVPQVTDSTGGIRGVGTPGIDLSYVSAGEQILKAELEGRLDQDEATRRLVELCCHFNHFSQIQNYFPPNRTATDDSASCGGFAVWVSRITDRLGEPYEARLCAQRRIRGKIKKHYRMLSAGGVSHSEILLATRRVALLSIYNCAVTTKELLNFVVRLSQIGGVNPSPELAQIQASGRYLCEID